MNLVLKVYSSYCEATKFIINDAPASYSDFGTKEDVDPENAPDFGCGNMIFIPKPASIEVLNKYSIDLVEYDFVIKELTEKLSFGRCSNCA